MNVIDRMETLLETSKAVPVTGGVIVDRKKMMELLDQLRLAIPQEVRAAEEVLGQKDQILNHAMTEARRTKIRAEEDYRERLDQNELVMLAQKRAEELKQEADQRASRLLQQAEAESQARRTEADAYALRSLRTLERELSALAGSVRKGIELLASEAVANGVNGSNGSSGYHFPE